MVADFGQGISSNIALLQVVDVLAVVECEYGYYVAAVAVDRLIESSPSADRSHKILLRTALCAAVFVFTFIFTLTRRCI